MTAFASTWRNFWWGFWRVVEGTSMEMLALFSGLVMFLWGGWLALPLHTFANSHAYDAMSTLAPEGAWAFLFMTLGAFQVYAVVHAEVSRDLRAWMYGSLAGLLGWSFIVAMFLMSAPTGTGIPVYALLALSCLNTFRRLA